MGRPVGTDQACAIDGEPDGKLLDSHIVNDLIVGTLQEGRVNGREGLHAFGRETGGERHRMLLGDADIEGAIRELFRKQVKAGAVRHRRRDADDAVVLARLEDEALGEHLRIGRRLGLRLVLRARDHVEFGNAVIFVGGSLRRGVAVALLGDHMNEDRTLLRVAHILQHRQ